VQEASKSGSTRRKQEGSYGASFVFFALRREARCSVKGSCAGWRAKGRSVTNRGEFCRAGRAGGVEGREVDGGGGISWSWLWVSPIKYLLAVRHGQGQSLTGCTLLPYRAEGGFNHKGETLD